MFCKKCGNEMPDYATQCDKCGTMVEGSSTAKQGFNKLLFIPIGVGGVAVIALVVALVFLLRPKEDIVQPAYNSVQAPGESQAPVIGDDSSVTQPPNTPSTTTTAAATTTAATESQPTEVEIVIPDALSFSVNGVNIPVSEAVYVDYFEDTLNNGIVLWGENSKYVAMAVINVPESLTEANVTYTGWVDCNEENGLYAWLYIYDIENHRDFGNEGAPDSEYAGQVIKIGGYSRHKFINLFVSTDIDDGRTTIPVSISGRFDYLSNIDMLFDIMDHFYDAVENVLAADDPVR